MRRILLPVLVIGVILLGACGAPSAPPVELPTTPPPTEEEPDYTSWIAWQLKELNQTMIQLLSPVVGVTKTEVFSFVICFNAEGQPIHEFGLPASTFLEAKTHINNAYWLTNKSKLPDEVWARDVSTEEIVEEVSEALALLNLQVSYSCSWQEDEVKRITETGYPSAYLPPSEGGFIRGLSEICDTYREELSRMISKLELILSRLPSTTGAEG